jgi:hypothetical protein
VLLLIVVVLLLVRMAGSVSVRDLSSALNARWSQFDSLLKQWMPD